MDVPAVFGINNSGVSLAVDLLILFLVVIWLALVYWTFADARRRISDPMLIGCSVVASLFPFVGTVVYTIVRPPEYLDDVRERELEIQAAEARLAQTGYHLCPHCDHEVDKDFLRCPSCMRKLKEPCRNCGRPLDPLWKLCPYCEAQVGAPAPASRRTRRRREGADVGVREPESVSGGMRRESMSARSVDPEPFFADSPEPGPRSARPDASGTDATRDQGARQASPETAAAKRRSPAS